MIAEMIENPSSIKAISPEKAIELLEAVKGHLESKGSKAILDKLKRNEAFICALSIATLSEVEDLFSDIACIRGCKGPLLALRKEVGRKRPRLDAFSGEMDPDVFDSLDKRENAAGDIVGVIGSQLNVMRVLQGDPKWEGRFKLNEFTHLPEQDGKPWTDNDETSAHLKLDEQYGINVPTIKVGETMRWVAEQHGYHPVRDYLNGIEWDGVERINTWLIDYCKSPDRKIVRAYSKRWMISAVARVMVPGCKVDTTLILRGEQGAGKSTTFAALCAAPEWFTDSSIDLRNKDAMAALQGVWIYEFPELSSFKRSDTNTTKAFLSSRVDRFRPSFGRNMVSHQRQCVIVGSTNQEKFMVDPTGSRRIWGVGSGDCDVKGLIEVRDQLWAEAVHLFNAGEQWWLTDAEEVRRKKSEHLFTEEDHLLGHVAQWLVSRNARKTSVTEIEAAPVHMLGVRLNANTRNRVVDILKILGYIKKRTTKGRYWMIDDEQWGIMKETYHTETRNRLR